MVINIPLSEWFFDVIKKFSVIIFILFSTFITVKIFQKYLIKFFSDSGKLLRVDTTQHRFLKHFISGLIYIIGISIAIFTV
ncbi:hypothetical protein GF327_07625, partial [Candidatus Woesearchaeota archaeon]|nr:hypothetical protein [Candidatus Woesearchaeota archaeon]